MSTLFTDLQGSTELLNRLGDEGNQELLEVHNNIVRDQISYHGGTEVKTMGDGFMIVFPNPGDAARCAIDVQHSLQQHNTQNQNRQLNVRMGINAGETILERGDYFGAAVVLAERVMAQATGGQVFVSDQFRSMSADSGEFRYIDRGWNRLKGFAVRQHIHELVWKPDNP